MDEMEFDRTRKAINAEKLDGDSRREMMQKLSSAGGKILREKSVGDDELQGKSRKKNYELSNGDIKLPSELYREKLRDEADFRSQLRQQQINDLKRAKSFLSRISIKLRCRLLGLASFTSRMAFPAFLSKLNLEGKDAIMECALIGNDVFRAEPDVVKKVIKQLDDIQPLYVELIERGAKIYDSQELEELLESYKLASDEPVPLDSIRAPLKSLLRKLYYLKTFQETYLTAVTNAFDILQSLEKKDKTIYQTKKKKITRNWRMLMNEIYPQMVLLLQRIEMQKMVPGGWLFEETLEISDAERIGNRKKGDPVGKTAEPVESDNENQAEIDTAEDELEEEVFSPQLSAGFRLMKEMPLLKLRKKHDPGGGYKNIGDNDKVFLTYLFFKEFEREYSFMLTSKRLQIASGFDRTREKDYVRIMAETFDKLRRCHDLFRQYEHQNGEYQYAVSESGPTVDNYVEHAKQVQKLEARRSATGTQLRGAVLEIVGSVSEIFQDLLKDIEGSQKLVQNSTEVISFDVQIEGQRRLNNKSVRDAIFEACIYATAFKYRLDSGDLYGGVIEMGEEDFAKAFTHDYEGLPPVSTEGE